MEGAGETIGVERNDSLIFVGLGNKQSSCELEQQGSSRRLPHGEGREGPGWWHWQVAVISRTGSLAVEMVLRWFDTEITKGECREPIPKRRKHPEDSWRRSKIPSVQGSAKPVKFGMWPYSEVTDCWSLIDGCIFIKRRKRDTARRKGNRETETWKELGP